MNFNFKGMQSLGLFTQLGLQIAGPIVVGAIFGNWLDGKFDTGSILTVVFLILGIYIGLSGAWKLVRTEIKRKNDD